MKTKLGFSIQEAGASRTTKEHLHWPEKTVKRALGPSKKLPTSSRKTSTEVAIRPGGEGRNRHVRPNWKTLLASLENLAHEIHIDQPKFSAAASNQDKVSRTPDQHA